MKRFGQAIRLVTFGLVVAAVLQELRKPPTERTWHGMVLGFVPYDFRPPTLERIKEVYWNPENPSVLAERVLGVGWGVNFYRLWAMLRGAIRPATS